MGWTHQKKLSLLVNLAVNSIQIKTLQVEQMPNRRGSTVLKQIRPQIHLYLQAPKSSFKSTALKAIAAVLNVPILTDVTFPAMVGSVDKETKQIIPAAAWECRNNALLIDEWADTQERKLMINALLQLTEGGYYARKVARFMAPVEEKDRTGLFFRAKDGKLEIQTRFSLVIATMKNLLRSTNSDIQALISRCVPYSFKLSEKETYDIMEGRPFISFEKKKAGPDVTVPHDVYAKILRYSRKARTEIYPRAVGDICRAWAIHGWKKEIFDFIIDRKNDAEFQSEIAKAELAVRLHRSQR